MTKPRFETMQSAGLEELLRRPDLPAADRQAIQQELGRRIAGNLSGPPPSPPVGMPMPQRAVPAQASGPPPLAPPRVAVPQHVPTGPPPQQARTPAPRRGSGRTAMGVFAAVLVAAAVVVAGLLYLNSGSDDPPPTQYGDTCYATDVYCPLAQQAPLGAPCQCFDPVGLAHTGTVG